jgi:hypothetical protein
MDLRVPSKVRGSTKRIAFSDRFKCAILERCRRRKSPLESSLGRSLLLVCRRYRFCWREATLCLTLG